jgi:hypothetical protein
MRWRNGSIIWSPIELEYLKAHREDTPIDQLSISLAKSRNAITNKLKELDGKGSAHAKKKPQARKAPDLGNIWMRSGWERDCCRYFAHIGWTDWIYEPQSFFFTGEKRGAISYLPDFYIPSQDIYIEVKGHLTGRGRSALKKFARFYPAEFSKLRAITGNANTKASKDFAKLGIPILAYFSDLKKQYRDIIPYWETK